MSIRYDSSMVKEHVMEQGDNVFTVYEWGNCEGVDVRVVTKCGAVKLQGSLRHEELGTLRGLFGLMEGFVFE